jgi:hypothetical protein
MMELGIPEVLLALITVVSPIFTAVAVQSKWDTKTKNAVAFGVALVIAVVYLVLTGGITDWGDITTAVLSVYGLQQLVYMQLLREISKKVEAATSVKSGEAIVVEEDKPNVTVETGEAEGQVVVVDPDVPDVPAQVNDGRADTEPRG